MEVEGLGDGVKWLWLKKLCSGIFSNMVEASMLREASIDVKQYMVSTLTPTSTDDQREVRVRRRLCSADVCLGHEHKR